MKYFRFGYLLIFVLFSCKKEPVELITDKGISNLDFSLTLDSIEKLNFSKIERDMYETESGEPYLGVLLYTNSEDFISLEINAETKEIYTISTNSMSYQTKNGLSVGDSFEEVINNNHFELLDGEGGQVVVYIREYNALVYFDNLEFGDDFYYLDETLSDNKSQVLKNVKDKGVKVNLISVLKEELPK